MQEFFNLIILKKLKNLISDFQWVKQKRWYRRICHSHSNFSSLLLQIKFCKLMINPLVTDCPVTLIACMFLEILVLLGLEIRKIREWGEWDLWWAGVLCIISLNDNWQGIILEHTQTFHCTPHSMAGFSFHCLTWHYFCVCYAFSLSDKQKWLSRAFRSPLPRFVSLIIFGPLITPLLDMWEDSQRPLGRLCLLYKGSFMWFYNKIN